MKKLFRNILPDQTFATWLKLKSYLGYQGGIVSYSQEGEDMILRRLFEDQHKGFYIDIGAHHPQRFSNTYYFYKLGWSGINVDATIGSMKSFRRLRPRDINIEFAIGENAVVQRFYVFNDPAINTFDAELANRRNTGRYKIIREVEISIKTLSDVLDEYLPVGQMIDFLTVDVEGMDLAVLHSNDWNRFSPKFVLVERCDFKLSDFMHDPVFNFLYTCGYEFIAKTPNTIIFQRQLGIS